MEEQYGERASAALQNAGPGNEFEFTVKDGAELFHMEQAFLKLGCRVSTHVGELKIRVFHPVTRDRDLN